jgi:hypothetical protein
VSGRPDDALEPGQPDARPDLREPDTAEPDIDPIVFAYEQRLAERRAWAIAEGRRKGGLAGAAMAGAMLAVSDIVEGPKKDEAPVVVEASSDPLDLEKDGFGATVGDVEVEAPPLERVDPVSTRKSRR